jgi:hypothetical protein
LRVVVQQNPDACASRDVLACVVASVSEAIHKAVLDCFVAELVIGPATSGRTRWLLAMTRPRAPQERFGLRHCERSEAIQRRWIASSRSLFAMTRPRTPQERICF